MKRFTKFRLASAVTAFVIFTGEVGILAGIVFSLVIALTTKLRLFSNVLPASLYEADGTTPKFIIEYLAAPIFMLTAATILVCSGSIFGALVLTAVALCDLLQDTEFMERIIDAINDKLHKI